MSAGFLAAAHFAAPAAGLAAAFLDELLELLHRSLDAAAHEADCVADLLDGALRLVFHRQVDARAVRAERLEAHGTRVRRLGRGAAPGDALVGDLLDDL